MVQIKLLRLPMGGGYTLLLRQVYLPERRWRTYMARTSLLTTLSTNQSA